jgi:hypothetical protein
MRTISETTLEADARGTVFDPGEQGATAEADARDDDASAPVWRELSAGEAAGIYPGVPLS